MKETVNLKHIYKLSEHVVAREVCEEFIIIPISSGVGDLEDEIFTLNETGRAIWDKLDGKRSLKDAAKELSSEFKGKLDVVEKDILGIVEELLKRKMLVKAK